MSCCQFSATSYGSIMGPDCCSVILPCGCCCHNGIEEDEELHVITLEDKMDKEDSEKNAAEILNLAKEQFKDTLYLPQSDNITRLLFLTTLNESKSPFTKKQVDAFQRSVRAAKATKKWLIAGSIIGTIFSIGGVIGAFSAYNDWSSDHQAEGFTYLASLATGVSLLSYSATGWNPDFSSNAANEWQNNESIAHEVFEEMAVELIAIHRKRPKLAAEIANQISLEVLKKTVKRDDPNSRPNLMDSIELACRYVLGKPLPRHKKSVAVKLAIQQQKTQKRVKDLEKKVEELAKSLKKE